MRTETIWQGLMLAPPRFLLSRWPWLALLSVVISAVLGIVLILPVVATVVILPLWGILFGVIERRRLRIVGAPARASGHVRVPREERHNWLGVRLTEPTTWREVSALLLGILLGLLGFCLLLAQCIAVGLPIALAVTALTQPPAEVNLFADVRVTVSSENWWHGLLALPLVLALAAYLNAAFTAVHAGVIGWLIAPRSAEIDRRVAQLTHSRAAIVSAHEAERRRIERDLHDGVQQELVGIAARLGILELELATGDADSAEDALRAAQDQTERALASLRSTVRGIHPAILTDHGLAAALSELAGRSSLPLRIHDNGMPRLDPAAGAAGYFLVTEAMTNAVKHTSASRILVDLDAEHDTAVIRVTDDGHGGADPERGTGLRGLAGRAEAIGGTLSISSPAGGPTVLSMSLALPADRAPRVPEGHADAHTARG
ncbi:signal transduction histidine kinase [Microbacterium sp. ZKA21]|uniref:sensor histidine kinase n=1 Tax=Microbacterium sp. ZKA21 TaxID=3381694 RepID=UPI003D1FF6DA